MYRCIFAALAVLSVGALATTVGSVASAQKAPSKVAPPGAKAAPKAPAKSEPKPAPQQQQRGREEDEKAVRANADAFAKAYNAHDAKAIAALFTPEAELVDVDGDAKQGRGEIERIFASVFEQFPDAKMSVDVKSIRFLSGALAVEDGVATVTHEPNTPADPNRYTVLHGKHEGKWLMASARDLPNLPEEPADQLEQLAWMVGEWVDESPDSLVKTSVRWSENHHYLLSEFTIHVAGRPLMNGTQRIAWDPLAKVLRSWVFDSEGGFAEGVYARDGDRWIVKMRGVTSDGQSSSATNISTHSGPHVMTWESRDRTVGGEAVEDVGPLTIVHKPPAPAAK